MFRILGDTYNPGEWDPDCEDSIFNTNFTASPDFMFKTPLRKELYLMKANGRRAAKYEYADSLYPLDNILA